MVETIKKMIEEMPNLEKSTLSQNEQLQLLILISNKLGLYDASKKINSIAGKRNGRGISAKVNRNSRTGIQGINVYYIDRGTKVLHVTAFWRESINDKKVSRTKQFSSLLYGFEGAIKRALDARRDGTGKKQCSYKEAIEKISNMVEENKVFVRGDKSKG